MHIGLVDHAFTHSKIGYSVEYITPKKHFVWDRSCDTDIIVFTDHCIRKSKEYYTDKKRIAWLIEPYELQMGNYNYVINHKDDFVDIFTHHETLTDQPIILAGTWIYKKDWKIYPKNKKVSIVASEKNYLTGHQLRHEAVKEFELDAFGRAYKKIDYKLETLKNYKYQIAIENLRINNWFTEKLIDCFLTGTIPIYWGAPNIGEFFNTNGMLIFDNLDSLGHILNNLDDISLPKEAVIENFNKAKFYSCAENQIFERIQQNNFYKN